MNITELINQLELFRADYGDVQVYYNNYDAIPRLGFNAVGEPVQSVCYTTAMMTRDKKGIAGILIE